MVIEHVTRVVGYLLKALTFAISLLVPRSDQLWVFMAGDGERVADNSKYLFLYCKGQSDVRNVWIGTDETAIDELRAAGYEAYLAKSIRGRLVMLRAGAFFETHGPIAPEYTGRARIVHLTHGNYLKAMLDDHTRDWPRTVELAVELFFERRRRYVVTSAGPPAENMQSMRGAPEERLWVTGFPRNDALLRKISGERIGVNEAELERFEACAAESDVLLYAPTYRHGYGEQNGIPLEELDLGFADVDSLLVDRDAHLFVSPHPDTGFADDLDDLDRVHLLDSGGDLYPFLRQCDALVTDYSGIFYDYLLVDRPILFYAPDLEAYLRDRELYFEYETHVPGPVATDSEDFVVAVADILDGEDEYAGKRAAVREQFYTDPDDGASERVYQLAMDSLGR